MNDNLVKITDSISKRVIDKPAFGHKVKLILSDVGTVYLDGTGDSNVVSNDKDSDADLTLETTYAVMHDLDTGQTDAFSAYMQGKLTIDGDQSIAVAFGSLIES